MLFVRQDKAITDNSIHLTLRLTDRDVARFQPKVIRYTMEDPFQVKFMIIVRPCSEVVISQQSPMKI